jgi:hypothetical protein
MIYTGRLCNDISDFSERKRTNVPPRVRHRGDVVYSSSNGIKHSGRTCHPTYVPTPGDTFHHVQPARIMPSRAILLPRPEIYLRSEISSICFQLLPPQSPFLSIFLFQSPKSHGRSLGKILRNFDGVKLYFYLGSL